MVDKVNNTSPDVVENGCSNLFDPYDLLGQGVKNSKPSVLHDSKDSSKAQDSAKHSRRDDFL